MHLLLSCDQCYGSEKGHPFLEKGEKMLCDSYFDSKIGRKKNVTEIKP